MQEEYDKIDLCKKSMIRLIYARRVWEDWFMQEEYDKIDLC